MIVELFQKPTFRRVYKKLQTNTRLATDDAIRDFIENPATGEIKIGDLSGIRVHKFKAMGQLMLLGYSYDESGEELTLLAIGTHQNFY